MPSQEAAGAAPAANWDIPATNQTWGDDLNYTNLVPIMVQLLLPLISDLIGKMSMVATGLKLL